MRIGSTVTTTKSIGAVDVELDAIPVGTRGVIVDAGGIYHWIVDFENDDDPVPVWDYEIEETA